MLLFSLRGRRLRRSGRAFTGGCLRIAARAEQRYEQHDERRNDSALEQVWNFSVRIGLSYAPLPGRSRTLAGFLNEPEGSSGLVQPDELSGKKPNTNEFPTGSS
jgi:hypothetical protein